MDFISRCSNVTVITFFIFLSVLYGCQQKTNEYGEVDTQSVISQLDPRVTELMKSMNIYQFDRPVKAPEFSLSSVHGNEVSLSQYRGTVVMLSFWATW